MGLRFDKCKQPILLSIKETDRNNDTISNLVQKNINSC